MEFVTRLRGLEVKVLGFDTLDNRNVVWKAGVGSVDAGTEPAGLVRAANDLGVRVEERASIAMDSYEGEDLSREMSEKLTKMGLAADMVLLPVSTMRTVLECATSTDVI